jgi:hypothetical protein
MARLFAVNMGKRKSGCTVSNVELLFAAGALQYVIGHMI